MSTSVRTRRYTNRPNGAYKLLTALLYSESPSLERPTASQIEVEGRGYARGLITIRSLRKLSRLLGTESKRVNSWLAWLEDQGYIEAVTYSENRRSCTLRLRRPRNIYT